MLQTICNDIGKIMLEGCANAGRMMLLLRILLSVSARLTGRKPSDKWRSWELIHCR